MRVSPRRTSLPTNAMRRHQTPVAISAWCALSGGPDLWDAGIEGEAAAYHGLRRAFGG